MNCISYSIYSLRSALQSAWFLGYITFIMMSWCSLTPASMPHLFWVKCFVILDIGIFIYTPQSMVMGLIMYAMTKHYYLLCFMFVIKISQLWLGDQSKTMFMFYTFYFLWTLNHGSCGLLFERTNNISVSSFEAARNMSLQVYSI